MARMLACSLVLVIVGCSGKDGGAVDDTGGGGDDTGGGGGVVWRPSGEGYAYFVDGAQDNSLFRLELSRATAPDVGQAYYGWLSKGGTDAISLGEIPVAGEDVLFDAELGHDGLLEGYDTFTAVQAPAGSPTDQGTALWAGQVDPTIYDTIQSLVITSVDTDDNEGILRAMETDLERLVALAEEGPATSDLDAYHSFSEKLYNGISDEQADIDGDGQVSTFDGQAPVIGPTGWVAQVLGGLDVISAAVDGGDPIKDFANYAYDCTQRVEQHAETSLRYAGSGGVCAAEASCQDSLASLAFELQVALDGFDLNGDGSITVADEGTVECAVYYVNQMARMRVEVP